MRSSELNNLDINSEQRFNQTLNLESLHVKNKGQKVISRLNSTEHEKFEV